MLAVFKRILFRGPLGVLGVSAIVSLLRLKFSRAFYFCDIGPPREIREMKGTRNMRVYSNPYYAIDIGLLSYSRETWPRSQGQPIPPGAQKDFDLEMEARRLENIRLSRIRQQQQRLREEETIYSDNEVVSSGSETGERRTESEVERAFGLYSKHGNINITSTGVPDELEINMM